MALAGDAGGVAGKIDQLEPFHTTDLKRACFGSANTDCCQLGSSVLPCKHSTLLDQFNMDVWEVMHVESGLRSAEFEDSFNDCCGAPRRHPPGPDRAQQNQGTLGGNQACRARAKEDPRRCKRDTAYENRGTRRRAAGLVAGARGGHPCNGRPQDVDQRPESQRLRSSW